MVIFLSGMQAVSADYYEAAKIDGATGWQRFRYITFPLILPSFNNALIINLVGGLKVFDLVQATTQGGPGTATEVFSTLMYKSFGSGRFGEGCAVTVTVIIISFMSVWNDFGVSVYFLNNVNLQTLPLTVYNFFGNHNSDWQLVFANVVTATIPVLILYLFLQKYIIEGMVAGSVKS